MLKLGVMSIGTHKIDSVKHGESIDTWICQSGLMMHCIMVFEVWVHGHKMENVRLPNGSEDRRYFTIIINVHEVSEDAGTGRVSA